MTPVERLLAKLPDAKTSGDGWSARCPAHDDQRASLSITEGDDGRALVYCHAGCSGPAICERVGLGLADLMPVESNPSGKDKAEIVATYDYRDEDGRLLSQVVRFDPKSFKQRSPKDGGGWNWSVKGARVVPYRLPELLANPNRAVVVVEGEKDVDNLARVGVLATCNPGGAGKWKAQHSEFLRGRQVVIVPDNDEIGRKHAQQVARSLQGIAARVRIVELPGLPERGDPSDFIAAGGTKEQLKALADSTPDWTPTAVLWPKIATFEELNLPIFPTDCLPPVLRNWVEEESHATQTPADLAGLLSLAVCSAAIARKVEVEPRSGWREPVNLFVAVLLEPGNRKTAVFKDALQPLRELESELIEAARPIVAKAQSERRQSERRLQRLEKIAAEKSDLAASHDAGELAVQLAESPEPALPRLIVDDATSEKLGMMLGEQGGRIASMSPEGGVFDLMAGLYSKTGTPQFGVYLMGHSGDDLVTDRVSRKSVRVQRPALTCAYAMQPQVIKGLADKSAFRGRGLLARFLYAAPRSWIGEREIAPEPMSSTTRAAYQQTVRELAEIEGERTLYLTEAASISLHEWETKIEEMLADGSEMEMFRDWGSKLAGATLRLAAVLHCVAHGVDCPIEEASIVSAIRIGRYLFPHTEAVLYLMQASEIAYQDDAKYVLRWIERHNRREFSKTEAQHHGKRRFPKADDVDVALAELVRRGYIRPSLIEATGPGRPPSPNYSVNPAIFSSEDARGRSHNSQNSDAAGEDVNSGNIRSALQETQRMDRVEMDL